jgi:protoporphyrin/coproporphyrin ferrochelatase
VSANGKAIGVLVMAYGGPNSLAEIPGYLADIRSGRPTPRAVIDAIVSNYEQIGGKSPLLNISRKQTSALSERLGSGYRCYLGMRHWAPWIEEVARDMVADGVTHAVSVVLAPHFSKMSVGRYQAKIADGLRMARGEVEFLHVESYHTEPKLIQAFSDRIAGGLQRWAESDRPNVHVVFSAHSLPARVLETGDPYDSQVRETARLVAERARLPANRWSWSYQSAGRTPEPWLGPQLHEHLPALAKKGIRNVLSVPVGFVSDHVEILFDVDIQAQAAARGLGMRLERPPALNDDPVYISLLADLVTARVRAAGWRYDS